MEATGRGWKVAMVVCFLLAIPALSVPVAGPYLFAAALVGLFISGSARGS